MSLAIFHPHFVIRIFPSAFFHPHFIIRIFLSAIRHPPSAIRHPVRTLQRPTWDWFQAFLHLAMVTCFPALGTGYKRSRAGHWHFPTPGRPWFYFTQTYPIRLYVSKLCIKVIQELLKLTVVFNDLGFKRRGICWYTMKINFNIRINNLQRKN